MPDFAKGAKYNFVLEDEPHSHYSDAKGDHFLNNAVRVFLIGHITSFIALVFAKMHRVCCSQIQHEMTSVFNFLSILTYLYCLFNAEEKLRKYQPHYATGSTVDNFYLLNATTPHVPRYSSFDINARGKICSMKMEGNS